MREWCGCGAAIRARRRDVLTWRTEHHCPTRPDTDDGAHISAGAIVERSYQPEDDTVRIGFHP